MTSSRACSSRPLGGLGLAAAGAVGLVACGAARAAPRDDCARLAAAERWPAAIGACEAAYADGHDDRDGFALARAYFGTDRVDDGLAIARGLHDDLQGHYLQAIALQESDPTEALLHASLALGAAVAQRQPDWVTPLAFAQAGAAKNLGKFALAERALGLVGDTVEIRLGRVNLMRAAGDYEAALALAQDTATAAEVDPALHAEALLQLGLVYIESGTPGLAKNLLRRAIDETALPDRVASAAMNLAFVEGEADQCLPAYAYLYLSGLLAADEFDWLLTAGRVALRCGDRARAAAWLDAARGRPHDGQWRWQVHDLLGALAESAGDLDGAARAYHAAIGEAEQLRRDGGRLAAIVAGKIVEPYQHAIDLAARRADWRAALATVLRYEQRPGRPAPEPDVDGALAAWRGRRLAILVRGRDQVWRLDVADGAVTGASIGALGPLAAVDLLAADDPDALAIARTLGAALPEVDALEVYLIGDLASVPLAALRRGDRRVLDRTALVRAFRVTPDPRPRPGPAPAAAVVLGDPGADLPGARDEASAVAATLGVSAHLGPAADRAALAAARGAALLHVAAHAEWTLDGPILPLADGAITAADLEALGPAPRLVVLASCFSARARDRGGWTSLAAGFLDAGAAVVISTQTSVDDAAARRLVEAFYAHGGATAPADALRRAQLDLAAAATDPHEWASFVALAAPPPAP